MAVLTFETCWALNNEIIKQVTSSWSIFIQRFPLDLVFLPEHLDLLSYRISSQTIVQFTSPAYLPYNYRFLYASVLLCALKITSPYPPETSVPVYQTTLRHVRNLQKYWGVPTRFETCRRHQKWHINFENCVFRWFVFYNCIIKVDLKEVEWKGVHWIDWVQAEVLLLWWPQITKELKITLFWTHYWNTRENGYNI